MNGQHFPLLVPLSLSLVDKLFLEKKNKCFMRAIALNLYKMFLIGMEQQISCAVESKFQVL